MLSLTHRKDFDAHAFVYPGKTRYCYRGENSVFTVNQLATREEEEGGKEEGNRDTTTLTTRGKMTRLIRQRNRRLQGAASSSTKSGTSHSQQNRNSRMSLFLCSVLCLFIHTRRDLTLTIWNSTASTTLFLYGDPQATTTTTATPRDLSSAGGGGNGDRRQSWFSKSIIETKTTSPRRRTTWVMVAPPEYTTEVVPSKEAERATEYYKANLNEKRLEVWLHRGFVHLQQQEDEGDNKRRDNPLFAVLNDATRTKTHQHEDHMKEDEDQPRVAGVLIAGYFHLKWAALSDQERKERGQYHKKLVATYVEHLEELYAKDPTLRTIPHFYDPHLESQIL